MKSTTTIDSKQTTEHDPKLLARLCDTHAGETITPLQWGIGNESELDALLLKIINVNSHLFNTHPPLIDNSYTISIDNKNNYLVALARYNANYMQKHTLIVECYVVTTDTQLQQIKAKTKLDGLFRESEKRYQSSVFKCQMLSDKYVFVRYNSSDNFHNSFREENYIVNQDKQESSPIASWCGGADNGAVSSPVIIHSIPYIFFSDDNMLLLLRFKQDIEAFKFLLKPESCLKKLYCLNNPLTVSVSDSEVHVQMYNSPLAPYLLFFNNMKDKPSFLGYIDLNLREESPSPSFRREEKIWVSKNIAYELHLGKRAYTPAQYTTNTLKCYKQKAPETQFIYELKLYNYHSMIDYEDFKIFTYNNNGCITVEIRSAESLQLLGKIIPENQIPTKNFSRCEVEESTYSLVIHELSNNHKHQPDTDILYNWHFRQWTPEIKDFLLNKCNIISDLHSTITAFVCLPQEKVISEGLDQPSALGYGFTKPLYQHTNPTTAVLPPPTRPTTTVNVVTQQPAPLPPPPVAAPIAPAPIQEDKNEPRRFGFFTKAIGIGAATAAVAAALYSKLK
jgi:hypothetical protein